MNEKINTTDQHAFNVSLKKINTVYKCYKILHLITYRPTINNNKNVITFFYNKNVMTPGVFRTKVKVE